MRLLLGLALLLSPFAAAAAQAEPWQLERSDVLMVTAADGHAYRVLLAWPEGEAPPGGWPVLWLLDGEDNFAIFTQTARRFARAGARSGVEPGLVVAIESGPLARRVFDYTPAAPGYSIPKGAPAAGLPTGGADAFLSLVAEKVRPLVVSRWRIDPRRQTLVGHSFGGLLGLHAVFKGQPFSTIVAVSPSLWYGGDLLSSEEKSFQPKAGQRIVIASGDAEGGPAGAGGTLSTEALAASLRQRGASARYVLLPGQSHGSTMLAATGLAITAAFEKEPSE